MARRLTLLIGPDERAATRFRSLCKQHATHLQTLGIETPEWNHVRLYAACAQTDEIGVLRHKRGLDHDLAQHTLGAEFEAVLAADTAQMRGTHVVMAAAQLGSLLYHPKELARLRSLLAPHFDHIRIVAHIQEQAHMLLGHYAQAVSEGRRHSLAQELTLASGDDWWAGALAQRGENDPPFGIFNDVQCPPFWLDYAALVQMWEQAFGMDNVTLRPLDPERLFGADGMAELCHTLEIPNAFATPEPARTAPPISAASLTRMRLMNEAMIRFAQSRDIFIPYEVKTQVYAQVRLTGPPIEPGSLFALSSHFASANEGLITRFPDLKTALTPVPATPLWQEADPKMGFRATQYLAAFVYQITKNARPVAQIRKDAALATEGAAIFDSMLRASNHDRADVDQLLQQAKANHQTILSSRFKPHNALGTLDEETQTPAFAPLHPQDTETPRCVVVTCMKNEAPYILEWIAYHRSIGVDQFLVYTNDCSDGTLALLDRLQAMGIVQHRDNTQWKGNSPQQHALNQAMNDPLIKGAAWIAHIDVDEFINVRIGNGTLADLLAAVPDATNIAMTWRLFGHDGVTGLRDDFVINQFNTCAPKFCPKPHTAWGYKTLFRNIGAYGKMSCHRPNKLNEAFETKVKWVNGSGKDITSDAAFRGWRSSKTTIGYDLVQLNHYALRSAESFLIKRQRGRALHVDRSIGISYWVRMDWSDARDATIKRNLPRLRAEYDRLMQDKALRAAHEAGFAWHQARAADLRAMPEFADLFAQATTLKLTATQRAALAITLDVHS